MSGPVKPFHVHNTATVECPQDILKNRSRPPVHEATDCHVVRIFTTCNLSESNNAAKHVKKRRFNTEVQQSVARGPLTVALPGREP